MPAPGHGKEGGRMNKAERLINLIALLIEARRPVTLEEIRRSVPGYQQSSVSSFKRMFERDKSELREMGVPIKVEPVDVFGEEVGYRIPKDEYYLPEIDFTQEEKVALLLVSRLSTVHLVPLSREARSALLKLSPDLGDGGRTGRFPSLPWRFDRQGESVEILTRLWEAVVKRKRVRFTYYSMARGDAVEREVDPYGLYFTGGAWYLVGYCHLRGETRSFRVSRIRSGVETVHADKEEPDFRRPPGFRLRNHSRILPWEFEEGAEYTAVVRFSPKVAWLVERDYGGLYPFERRKDGSGDLHVTVRNEDAFFSWLFSYAEEAEVVSPPSLRGKAVERLRGMMERLGEG